MDELSGEWILRACIMQCEALRVLQDDASALILKDAVLGRVHFTDTGDVIYLTIAGDCLLIWQQSLQSAV